MQLGQKHVSPTSRRWKTKCGSSCGPGRNSCLLSVHVPVPGEEVVEDAQGGLQVTVHNVWGKQKEQRRFRAEVFYSEESDHLNLYSRSYKTVFDLSFVHFTPDQRLQLKTGSFTVEFNNEHYPCHLKLIYKKIWFELIYKKPDFL